MIIFRPLITGEMPSHVWPREIGEQRWPQKLQCVALTEWWVRDDPMGWTDHYYTFKIDGYQFRYGKNYPMVIDA